MAPGWAARHQDEPSGFPGMPTWLECEPLLLHGEPPTQLQGESPQLQDKHHGSRVSLHSSRMSPMARAVSSWHQGEPSWVEAEPPWHHCESPWLLGKLPMWLQGDPWSLRWASTADNDNNSFWKNAVIERKFYREMEITAITTPFLRRMIIVWAFFREKLSERLTLSTRL